MGVFRAHTFLLKNTDYKAHIYNIILCMFLEDIKDKSSSDFVNWISILQAKEELEQKKISPIYGRRPQLENKG